jgi:protein TonB
MLHALPFVLWIAWGMLVWHPRPPANVQTLQMDLVGMLSDVQVEERHKVDETPPEPEEETPPPPPPVPEPEKESVPMEQPKPPPSKARPRIDRNVPRGEEQVQRTVRREDAEASAMRKYLAELGLLLRSRLVYPVKARVKGWTGVTTVAFTVDVDGSVVQGSARVARSSGYPDLDDAAMNAVRGMGQVPPPPKRTDVSIAVNFREEKAQGR